MTIRDLKQTVMRRPGRARPALDAVASRGLLTWWDLMSDLDPGWLEWSESLGDGSGGRRRVA